jgi:hypothetical protein
MTNDELLYDKRVSIFWAVGANHEKKMVDGKMLYQKGIERFMCESSSKSNSGTAQSTLNLVKDIKELNNSVTHYIT